MAKARKKPAKTMVELTTTGKKAKTIEFEISHALRLLKMPNTQWQLKDKNFEFTGNDIKRKSSKKTDSVAKEQSGN